MNYYLLTYTTNNIGDDIQSLAAKQWLPRVDSFVDRDLILNHKFEKDHKIICNGWWSHPTNNLHFANFSKRLSRYIRNLGGPENALSFSWPVRKFYGYPPKLVKGLFTSIHFTPDDQFLLFLAKNNLLSRFVTDESGIGCRDLATYNFCRHYDVPAYFSGCLTLTLKNPDVEISDQIVISDLEVPDSFLISLRKFLGPNVVLSTNKLNLDRNYSPEERLEMARSCLKTYAAAKLVITSRLHVALPCAAFNTPFLFVPKNMKDPRFSGLEQILDFKNQDDLISLIRKDYRNTPAQLELVEKLKETLSWSCKNFIS